MAEADDKLTEQQKKFCNEFLINLNATQAAIRAGYSEKSARSIASENLTKPNIQNYLQQLQEGIQKRNQISQDEILQDLIEIKNRCMQNVPVMYYDKEDKEWKQEGADCGEPVYKFDSQGATKALDLIAKHTGFYKEDNEQKTNVNAIFNVCKSDFEEVRKQTKDMFDE